MRHDYLNQKPRYCCWVLNYRCMFKCRMCRIWSTTDAAAQETTMEQKKQFVRSLRGFVDPGFEFHLSGGEPLMTEGILDLVDLISREGYRTNLVTNGFLINESMAKDITRSRLDTLTISLDGFAPETHDEVRGMQGSCERIHQAIGYLEKYRVHKQPKISILTVIMESNLKEIPELVEWVQHDERLEMISLQAITQPFGEEADSSWHTREKNRSLWPQDARQASEVMGHLYRLRRDGYKIGNHPNHFLHFDEYFKDPNRFLKKIKCNLGDYEFHVDPYGKVFFCCSMQPLGNIKTGAVPELWPSSLARDIREAVYHCKNNCHIMVNCFYEDEIRPA